MSETGRARVLIVDDDGRVRRALRALLEAEDGLVVVGEAGTPAEVLALADALQPAVILLDLLLRYFRRMRVINRRMLSVLAAAA